MDLFSGYDPQIALTYDRRINNVRQSGLAITVQVTNASTGATLLAATSCPEIGSTGIYTYNWTHGLTTTTQCLVTFLKAGVALLEDSILIQFSPAGARGV